MLAIAMLIALAVLPAMINEPVFASKFSEQESAAFWSDAEIGLESPYFGNSAYGRVYVQNNKKYAITLVNISDENNFLVSNSSDENRLIQPGQRHNLVTNSSGRPCNGKTAGARFELRPAIFYEDASDPDQTFVFRGAKPLVGECQPLTPA